MLAAHPGHNVTSGPVANGAAHIVLGSFPDLVKPVWHHGQTLQLPGLPLRQGNALCVLAALLLLPGPVIHRAASSLPLGKDHKLSKPRPLYELSMPCGAAGDLQTLEAAAVTCPALLAAQRLPPGP